jgi:hypothetical protein
LALGVSGVCTPPTDLERAPVTTIDFSASTVPVDWAMAADDTIAVVQNSTNFFTDNSPAKQRKFVGTPAPLLAD